MTLGESLEEIKKSFFFDDLEAMNNFGMFLISELKQRYFPSSLHPKNGWLIAFSNQDSYLIHRDLKVLIDENQNKEVENPLHSEEGKEIGDSRDVPNNKSLLKGEILSLTEFKAKKKNENEI